MLFWIPLNEEAKVKEIIEQSHLPDILGVLLFKHSTRCSISKMAKSRLESKWKYGAEQLPVYYLDLLAYRPISNVVASAFNIQHESPQLLFIKNGKCEYVANHNEISVAELTNFIHQQAHK